MSEQGGPPQGMETKNVPGYVVAQPVNADHPGHMTDRFAGKAGYTNTPGITDPADEDVAASSGDAEQSGAGDDSGGTESQSGDGAGKAAPKKTTATGRASSTAANKS